MTAISKSKPLLAWLGWLACCVGLVSMTTRAQSPVWNLSTRFYPSNNGNHRDITFANGLFVVCGTEGTIITSPDAIAWTVIDTGTFATISQVCYGNGMFVAVGSYQDGEGVVLISENGISWAMAPGAPRGLRTVCFGDGLFVAASSEMVYTSANGSTWAPSDVQLRNVNPYLAYQGGEFFLLEEGGHRSADGIHWTDITGIPAGEVLSDVVFANGLYVAVGNQIYVSTDGLLWIPAQTMVTARQSLVGITYNNGQFVTTGYSSNSQSPGGVSYTSSDGLHWTEHNGFRYLAKVASGKGLVVACGFFRDILTSNDGAAWETHFAPSEGTAPGGIAETRGILVASGDTSGRAFVASSSDGGRNWSRQTLDVIDRIKSMVAENGLFVGVGYSNAFSSLDGTNWTVTPLPELGPYDAYTLISPIFSAHGHFFATTRPGGMLVSQDGRNWTRCSISSSDVISGVAYGQGKYVAVGGPASLLSNSIYTSTNAVEWVRQPQQPGNSLVSLAYGNGRFVAPQWIGPIFISEDGVNWSAHEFSPLSVAINRLTYAQGRFIGRTTQNDNFWFSTDGVSWRQNWDWPRQQVGAFTPAGEGLATFGYPTAVWTSTPLSRPFAVSVIAAEDGFEIRRINREVGRASLEVPYAIAIIGETGATTTHTNVALIPSNSDSIFVYPEPWPFSKATLTLLSGDASEIVSPESATLSLPDHQSAPKFRRNAAISEGRIYLTLDALLNTKVSVEQSTNLQAWSSLGTFTNSTGIIQLDIPLQTNGARSFFRAKVLE